MSVSASSTGKFSAVQALFWMQYCVFYSFSVVYLQMLGYSNTVIGVILAAGNLLGGVLGPELSSLIDRNARVTARRLTPPLLALQALFLALLLACPRQGVVTSLAFVLFIAVGWSVNSMNLKLYTDALRSGRVINYGLARGFGSLAYVAASVGLGAVIEKGPLWLLCAVGLGLTAAQLSSFLLLIRDLPSVSSSESAPVRGTSVTVFLRRNPRFAVLLAGTALVYYGHNTIGGFFINVIRNVGGDASVMGLLNGLMAAIEIPVMMLFQRLFGRRDLTRLLAVSLLFFCIKGAAIALAGSVSQLSWAMVLQAPSFALYTAAVVPYVDKMIPPEDSAKAQSLTFSMPLLGSVLAGIVSGRLYDALPVSSTLWIACAVCTAGAAVCLLALRRESRQAV
jgi:PPP family 3-phenylpropionic acid transporter